MSTCVYLLPFIQTFILFVLICKKLLFTMESNVTKVINGIMNNSKVRGVVVSDSNGLLLGAAGDATTVTTGIMTALLDLATKLESNSSPTVVLENFNNQCTIQGNDKLVLGVYETTS